MLEELVAQPHCTHVKVAIKYVYTYGVAPSFLHVKTARPILDHLGRVVHHFIVRSRSH